MTHPIRAPMDLYYVTGGLANQSILLDRFLTLPDAEALARYTQGLGWRQVVIRHCIHPSDSVSWAQDGPAYFPDVTRHWRYDTAAQAFVPAVPPAPAPVRRVVHYDPVTHTEKHVIPDRHIIAFYFDEARIEIRHHGTYLDVHHGMSNTRERLSVEPRMSNQIWLRLERTP